MFCKNCGQESKAGQKFCINCGNSFPMSDASQEHVLPKSENISRPPMPKKPWTTKRIIRSVLAIVLVGGFFLLRIIFAGINSIDSDAIDKNNDALTAFNSGNSQEAITQFQQASEDAITNNIKITTKINLAYAYSTEGKDDLALSTFKEALALTSPDTFNYYLVSGEIALLEGKPNAALIAYNKAYEKDSGEFQINNALSLFYVDINSERPQYENYPKALTYALKAYELEPSRAMKENLAIVQYFNDNYAQAITLMKESDFTASPYMALWLGLAYAADNQVANAKYYFRMAINNGTDVPQEVYDYMSGN